MAIQTIPQTYINNNGCFTPIRTGLNKINEVINALENGTNSDIAVNSVTTTANVTVGGKISAVIGTITQPTSVTTNITLNSAFGKITTFSSTLAAQGESSFVLTNSLISSSSLLLFSLSYIGTGIPVITYLVASAGSVSINIYNASTSAALSGPVIISYQVIS